MKKLIVLLYLISSVSVSAQLQNSSPVNLNNKSNVTISNLRISGASQHGISVSYCSNIIIENCVIENTVGNGIYLQNSNNITIRNCSFKENASGVYAQDCGSIVVVNNNFYNVNGPRPRGQFVQFNRVNGSGNKVSCNYMQSVTGQGDPEDAISMHETNGTSGSPVLIENNYINGGGPSGTGGGIMLGDGGGSWLKASSNVLVNSGQYGIAVAGGSNMEISGNKIWGKQFSWSNVGIYVWNQQSSGCSNNKVLNNQVYWINSSGKAAPEWDGGNCSGTNWSGNSWQSTSVSENMAAPSCAGVTGSSPSAPAPAPAPSSCAAGTLLVETYANIQGKTVPDLTNNSAYPNSPSASSTLTSFSYGQSGEYFGRRTRGYICPPTTGSYTFYLACDDAGELWLSTDANPANKQKIAYLTSWVAPGVYDAVASQKSASIQLTAGTKYYIETVHKAGTGNDHLSVAWTTPNGAMEAPIPASRITGSVSGSTPAPAPAPSGCGAGTLTVDVYANIQGKAVTDLTNNGSFPNSPSSTVSLSSFSYGQSGDYYGRRTRGYVCAPTSGNYTFYLACDDAGELWLSTDDNPSNKQKIAYLTSWVAPGVYDANSTQKSSPISLSAGVKYYIEVIHKAGTGNDHMSVAWTLPNGTTEAPIPSSRITGSASGVPSQTPSASTCTTGGTLLVEVFPNIQGKVVSDLTNNGAYPNSPSSTLTLSNFSYGQSGDYYGRRVRGYICAPQSGNYTFNLACDDAGELWLSTDDNPANKQKIAYLTTWVPPGTYTQVSTQKSGTISLTAGKRYYIEAIHKAGTGNDHLSVAWTLPNGTFEAPISSIAPYNTAIGTNSVVSTNTAVMMKATEENSISLKVGLTVKATPNPSRNGFNIQVQSDESMPASIRVTDIMGRLVEQRNNIQKASNFQIGQNWAKGIYVLEFIQGKQRRLIKLMKE